STTGSSSPSSSVTHAIGRRAASASRHIPSSVVLPQPAGAATTVSFTSGRGRSWATSRSRTTVCARDGGGCSFVSSRAGGPTRSGIVVVLLVEPTVRPFFNAPRWERYVVELAAGPMLSSDLSSSGETHLEGTAVARRECTVVCRRD